MIKIQTYKILLDKNSVLKNVRVRSDETKERKDFRRNKVVAYTN